jgi:cytochrome c oxidase cbb3-type subunit 3
MADAKALFTQRCTPCHGNDAQGVIGPNLTDDYWLHGGSLLEIHHTVSEGVPEKGMPPWKAQLSPVQLRQLAALVGSFRGKNLPGKPPEGALVPPAH